MIQHTITFFSPACLLGYPVLAILSKSAIKYCTKKCNNLHYYIWARSTCHRTLLHTHTYQHTMKSLMPYSHLRQNILYGTNLSHSPLRHPKTLHTLSCTSTYKIISAPDWLDSKSYSIRSYAFSLDLIKNKLIDAQIQKSYGPVHVGHDISAPKESIIYTLRLWSWMFYWVFSSTITHCTTHPH